ncbi:uncharacterized protein [Nicotiana tomentosiformis]|uniref:uncharacterized protein n=1 Tax=Nicotiana tomentosiformis TaxID=4098 RepID=UPI00388C682F
MDGQSKLTIQILEDMLQSCVIDFGGHLDGVLPLAEFAYNNNYHPNIQMALCEALYGRQRCSPIIWFGPGEARLLGTYWIRDALEKVKLIQEWLPTAQSWHKSYADKKVHHVEFMEDEKVLVTNQNPTKS